MPAPQLIRRAMLSIFTIACTGTLPAQPAAPAPPWVRAVVFSPDGKWIAASTGDPRGGDRLGLGDAQGPLDASGKDRNSRARLLAGQQNAGRRRLWQRRDA